MYSQTDLRFLVQIKKKLNETMIYMFTKNAFTYLYLVLSIHDKFSNKDINSFTIIDRFRGSESEKHKGNEFVLHPSMTCQNPHIHFGLFLFGVWITFPRLHQFARHCWFSDITWQTDMTVDQKYLKITDCSTNIQLRLFNFYCDTAGSSKPPFITMQRTHWIQLSVCNTIRWT